QAHLGRKLREGEAAPQAFAPNALADRRRVGEHVEADAVDRGRAAADRLVRLRRAGHRRAPGPLARPLNRSESGTVGMRIIAPLAPRPRRSAGQWASARSYSLTVRSRGSVHLPCARGQSGVLGPMASQS